LQLALIENQQNRLQGEGGFVFARFVDNLN